VGTLQRVIITRRREAAAIFSMQGTMSRTKYVTLEAIETSPQMSAAASQSARTERALVMPASAAHASNSASMVTQHFDLQHKG